jgi:xanthine dehydrogenase accessory factor
VSAADTGALLDAWRELRADDTEAAVLATVVHVQGSAYRRPGARMLIRPDGSRVGSISGGCLDGDVVRKACWATANERPALRVYDTTSDDDAAWAFGLGCNGVVHVLLERVVWPETRATLEFLDARRTDRRPGTIATVVASDHGVARVGERLLVAESGHQSGALATRTLAGAVGSAARSALQAGESHLLHLDGCDVFVEAVRPPTALLVLGGGHDVVPLVTLASGLGWEVTVADCRPAYARAERFPDANRVLLLDRDDPLAGISLDADTAVVLMTHDFAQDACLLAALLPRSPRYVGILGAASRAVQLLSELGTAPPPWLHAPIGLDIGAETPAEIALAIAAEIRAASAGRPGGTLRLRSTSIHEPVAERGLALAARKPARIVALCGLAASHA